MKKRYKGCTPNKLGLKKCKIKVKTTTDNRTYKIARLLEVSVSCIVCMGRCRAYNIQKRNNGQKPRYKDIDRKSIRLINLSKWWNR